MAKTKNKNKKGFAAGIGERYRDTVELSTTLVREPRAFPARALKTLRRSVRKLWNLRGGGLYACGFVITFLYLEAVMFIDDLVNFDGFGSIGEEIVGYFVRFATESLANTVQAFLWPIYVIELSPLWGGIALGLGFWLFPLFLKKPIEEWLFQEDEFTPKAKHDDEATDERR